MCSCWQVHSLACAAFKLASHVPGQLEVNWTQAQDGQQHCTYRYSQGGLCAGRSQMLAEIPEFLEENLASLTMNLHLK